MNGEPRGWQTITSPCQTELSIQKSRFLGLLYPCQEASAARELLRSLKTEYREATHVVHAFLCGSEASLTMGCSDDGEPSGTAGRPVLEVLKGGQYTDVFLAVIRWFGGIKLGTGGLSRAYADTAKAVLALAEWKPRRLLSKLTLEVPFADEGRLRRALERFGVKQIHARYEEAVCLDFEVEQALVRELEVVLTTETQGRARCLNLGS